MKANQDKPYEPTSGTSAHIPRPNTIVPKEFMDNLKTVGNQASQDELLAWAIIKEFNKSQDIHYEKNIVNETIKLINAHTQKEVTEARINEAKANQEAVWYEFDPNGEGETSTEQRDINAMFDRRIAELQATKDTDKDGDAGTEAL